MVEIKVRNWARENCMQLGVAAGNDAAASFYERLGGTTIGREPADWAEGVWHDLYRWPDLAPSAR